MYMYIYIEREEGGGGREERGERREERWERERERERERTKKKRLRDEEERERRQRQGRWLSALSFLWRSSCRVSGSWTTRPVLVRTCSTALQHQLSRNSLSQCMHFGTKVLASVVHPLLMQENCAGEAFLLTVGAFCCKKAPTVSRKSSNCKAKKLQL